MAALGFLSAPHINERNYLLVLSQNSASWCPIPSRLTSRPISLGNASEKMEPPIVPLQERQKPLHIWLTFNDLNSEFLFYNNFYFYLFCTFMLCDLRRMNLKHKMLKPFPIFGLLKFHENVKATKGFRSAFCRFLFQLFLPFGWCWDFVKWKSCFCWLGQPSPNSRVCDFKSGSS